MLLLKVTNLTDTVLNPYFVYAVGLHPTSDGTGLRLAPRAPGVAYAVYATLPFGWLVRVYYLLLGCFLLHDIFSTSHNSHLIIRTATVVNTVNANMAKKAPSISKNRKPITISPLFVLHIPGTGRRGLPRISAISYYLHSVPWP